MVDANDLVYLRARYYHPGLGVFPSLDPVEGCEKRAMSLNRYGYVEGNVVNIVDRTGKYGESPSQFETCQSDDADIPKCNFPGTGEFFITNNDVVYAIAIAIWGEGRFAGSPGLAISAAAAINKLRNGSHLSQFGGDYGAALHGLLGECGGYENANSPIGVNSVCINPTVEGIISGDYSGGGQPQNYPGGNAVAMEQAVDHVRVQLLGECKLGSGRGADYYKDIPGKLGLTDEQVEKIRHVHSDTNLNLALTFHASWAEDLETLACCMRVDERRDDPPVIDYLDYEYVVFGDEGVLVSTINMLGLAFDAAQKDKTQTQFEICEAGNGSGGYLFSSRARDECQTRSQTTSDQIP